MNIKFSIVILILGLSCVHVLANPVSTTTTRRPVRLCAMDIIRRMKRLCLGCTKAVGEKLSPIGGGEPVIDKRILQEAINENLSTPIPGRLNLSGTLTDICCEQSKCYDEFLLEFCCTTEERAMVRSGGTTSAP
ncbi:unnamed protein product [Auanema sp. JU1783]|nr:unnamed protein product [Auanema sp. JU1783]